MTDEGFIHPENTQTIQIGREMVEDITYSDVESSPGEDAFQGLRSSLTSLPVLSVENRSRSRLQTKQPFLPTDDCLKSPDSLKPGGKNTESPSRTSLNTANSSNVGFENLQPLYFQEGLTSEAALFQACWHVIGELEAVAFSDSLPEAFRQTEKLLVNATELCNAEEHPSLRSQQRKQQRDQDTRRRCLSAGESAGFERSNESSCLRLRRFKSLAFVHSTRDVFFSLLVDDSDSSANNSDPNDDSPEPCQAAHIVGGLLRVVARSRFAASRPPLRLRRLQEHVASMLDADWVAYGLQWRHAPGDVERRRFELAQALVKSTQSLDLPKVWSLPTLRKDAYSTRPSNYSHGTTIPNATSPRYDPLSAKSSSSTPPHVLALSPGSSASQLPAGVENFFRSAPTPNNIRGGEPRIGHLLPKRLITSPPVSKSDRKAILQNQQNYCAGYIRSMRFCEYFGRYFCCVCHANTLMVIPGILLNSWSTAMLPVSKFASDLLVRFHARPLLHTSDFGAALRSKKMPWALRDAIHLRKQAMAIVPFLRLCPNGISELGKFDQLPVHWIKAADSWSLADLIALANAPEQASMSSRLREALETTVAHLAVCLRCRARGHLCEVCHRGKVLFPHFGQPDTLVCADCGACFHRRCLAVAGRPDRRTCSRCLRWQKRHEDTDAP